MFIQEGEIYKNLVENIAEGVIALNQQWEVVYMNAFAEKVLNRLRTEMVGKNIWEEFPQAVGNAFYVAYHKAMEEKQSATIEEFSVTLQRYTQARIHPSDTGLFIYFHDITSEKIAEIRAQNSENNYRNVLDRITDGFIALDKNFYYTYMNEKAAQIVHRKSEDLIGKNVWDEFPAAVGSYTYRAMQTAMKEQRFISNIDYYPPLNLWQENYIYPSPEGLSIFIKDISERKQLEIELKENEEKKQLEIAATAIEAQEKERLQIGRELHDNVNQIITATKLALSFLKDHPERSEALLPQCIDNLDRAITENRKLAHELVPPDFTQVGLVGEITRLFHTMFQTRGIQTEINQGQFDEQGLDAAKKLTLYRIVQEQCTNIAKYAKPSKVACLLATDREAFQMTIADDGKGISKEPSSVKGVGLKNIEGRLKIYGGSMHIESAPDKGFTLHVTIPMSAA